MLLAMKISAVLLAYLFSAGMLAGLIRRIEYFQELERYDNVPVSLIALLWPASITGGVLYLTVRLLGFLLVLVLKAGESVSELGPFLVGRAVRRLRSIERLPKARTVAK